MSSPTKDAPRIVLVEDDPSFRQLLGMAINLQKDMQMVASYCNGREALDNIEKQSPDLIIADYSMPLISGRDLLLAIKEKFPQLLFVLLSGHSESEYAVSSLNAGADGYILKGKPQEIIAGIKAVLDGQRYVSPKISDQL